MEVPAVPDPLELAVADALDAAEPQAPGWLELLIRRMPSGSGLRLARINPSRTEPAPTPLPSVLGIDAELRQVLLSRALDRIHDRLHERGIIWDGLTARLERERAGDDVPTTVGLTTVQGASVARLTLGRPDRLRVLTRALGAALVDVRAQARRDKEQIEASLGRQPAWRLDEGEGLVRFHPDSPAALAWPAEIVGTYGPDDARWVWAWAEPRDPASAAGPRRILPACQQVGRREGLAAARRTSFPCEPDLARAVAELAAAKAGGVALEENWHGVLRVVAVYPPAQQHQA
jgi:hypothetical protein